jgi:hypothetical protein
MNWQTPDQQQTDLKAQYIHIPFLKALPVDTRSAYYFLTVINPED